MLYLGRISDVSARYDENWLVVRSLRAPVKDAKQVALLSPSKELFFKYRAAANAGRYDAKWFAENYVPDFIRQLAEDREALQQLDYLYRSSFEKDILLACFCSDETLCHRSILGGLLKGAGANIQCPDEYLKYYNIFDTVMKNR